MRCILIMNENKKNQIAIIVITILFSLSVILIMIGINDLAVKDDVAANVELSKLYIDLGYSSISEWLNDYMLKIYLILAGGSFFALLAIWLLVKRIKGIGSL